MSDEHNTEDGTPRPSDEAHAMLAEQSRPSKELLTLLATAPKRRRSRWPWPTRMTKGDVHPNERRALWEELEPLIVIFRAQQKMDATQYASYCVLEPLFRQGWVETYLAYQDYVAQHGVKNAHLFEAVLRRLRNSTAVEFRTNKDAR